MKEKKNQARRGEMGRTKGGTEVGGREGRRVNIGIGKREKDREIERESGGSGGPHRHSFCHSRHRYDS